MKNIKKNGLAAIALISSVALSPAAYAEEKSSDKTGTNPVNFSNDARLYNEYSWLNTEGDGTQNFSTAELRTSFFEGKWQWRVRAHYNAITADLNDDGTDDVDESGIGDTDMRFLTVPYLNMAEKRAFAVGLEVFMDTASEDVLGSGTTSLGPQVFMVFFKPFGINGLFGPGVQYKFSVDEEEGRSDVDQVLIDLNFLRMSDDKTWWFFTDPQIVIDNENDTEFAIVDFEFGFMMNKWFDLKGHSFYVRPSVGVGDDRPTDGSIEVGYKIVGW